MIEVIYEGNQPSKAHPDDAGFDLVASEEFVLTPGQSSIIPTGTSVALPRGTVGFIAPRSGMASKYGITVLNAPGVIDSGYTGEVKVNLINHGPYEVEFPAGSRIAQLVVMPISPVNMIEGDVEKVPTVRGSDGHGSTGF